MGVSAQQDEDFMLLALQQAKLAAELGEVPVGAVVVYENSIIARAHNQQITTQNPTAHAEVLVLEQAAQVVENYRLPGCTLYVTLEPCLMCVGAMVHARIERLVYGAADPKTGMAGTVDNLFEQPYHNHRISYDGGIMAEKCGQLLQDFFKARRLAKKSIRSE
ncbi:tRNA-specific adenosine deaminase [Marinicella pacifica]|jgi:tRNA(adenine34) deaminase|uniref:tRNA-specific adenosine deaminase n=1 Tax=Marinicella pacifica TaxID=1171543 RepID=A0A917CJR3_9GAMM|nr:tRNA adenosine(34) deaminase TadA [Marinicella pacifica]GGF91022.1 tRNA-specific adenosine deaminase [Marinicella pacifica]